VWGQEGWTKATIEGDSVSVKFQRVIPAGEDVVLAETESGLVRSTDHGYTWQRIPADNHHKMRVAMKPDGHGVAICKHDSVFNTTDRGATWTKGPYITVDYFTTERLSLVWMTDSVYLATQLGANSMRTVLARSTDEGKSWLKTPLMDSTGWPTFCRVDDSTMLYGSMYGVYRSRDRGLTWTMTLWYKQRKPIRGMDLVSPNFILAAREDGVIYRSTDTGSTWSEYYQMVEGDVSRIALKDTSTWIFGAALNVWVTTDAGTTWMCQPRPRITGWYGKILDVCRDNDHFYAVENFGTLDVCDQVGERFENRWEYYNDTLLATAIERQVGYHRDAIWVPGYAGILHRFDKHGRLTENVDLKTTLNVECVNFFNDEIGIVSGENGIMYRTTDGGASWDWIPSATPYSLRHLSLDKSGSGVGYYRVTGSTPLGCGIMTKTTNYGATWFAIDVPMGASRSMQVVDSQTIVSVYGNKATMSNDLGVSWNTVFTDDAWICRDISFANRSEGVIQADNGDTQHNQRMTIFHTSDGGETWSQITLPTNVGIYDPNRFYRFVRKDRWNILFHVYNGLVYRTTDGGQTWEREATGYAGKGQDGAFFTTNESWAHLGRGRFLFSRRDDLVSVRSGETEVCNDRTWRHLLSEGSGSLNVYAMTPPNTTVRCELVDVSGRIVDRWISPSGETQIRRDVSSIQPGCYFLLLASDPCPEVVKLVITRD